MSRQLKPCGTPGGYGRHIFRKESPCQPCREAWREYQIEYDKARARTNHDKAATPRELAPCGSFAAAQRHRKNGEELCGPCRQADRDYKAQKARDYRAAKKDRREALDQLLAETWAEVSGS